MAIVSVVNELLGHHSDAELVAYIYTLVKNVDNAMTRALSEGKPEIMWAASGELARARELLKGLKTRNEDRLAQR